MSGDYAFVTEELAQEDPETRESTTQRIIDGQWGFADVEGVLAGKEPRTNQV